MSIFKSLMFEYSGMGSKPTGFNYLHLKDMLKWNGLKKKQYIDIFVLMFKNYINNLK